MGWIAKKNRLDTANTFFNKKNIISAAVIFAILIILIFLSVYLKNRANREISPDDLNNLESGAVKRVQSLYQPDRDPYGNLGGSDIKIRDLIEKELPPLPDDFWKVKYNFVNYQDSPKNLCGIEERYYVQPEWVGQPSKFVQIQIPYYKEGLDKTNWYREGIGGYPAIHRINTKPGEEFEICTYIFTGWRVETFQGVKLIPVQVSNIEWENQYAGMNFITNSHAYAVTLQEPEFLLEPVYPIVKKGWIRPVKMIVKVDKNATKGNYAFRLDISQPDDQKSKEWLSTYMEKYVQGSFVTSSVPVFQAILVIE